MTTLFIFGVCLGYCLRWASDNVQPGKIKYINPSIKEIKPNIYINKTSTATSRKIGHKLPIQLRSK